MDKEALAKTQRLEGDVKSLNRQVEQKNEEVSLYKGKYEDMVKQVAEVVSSFMVLLISYIIHTILLKASYW